VPESIQTSQHHMKPIEITKKKTFFGFNNI